ncbi:hypothetical protein L9F63_002677 [Diploptera punctata]|uniref:Uncharacterized protein n=1 Tax=Diploptera punctata TaxID=6984 RepID=A0AAD8ECR4_DIPPU|nr:hypothetical protein L9F63_002677 [Diploptera punctata]
MVDTLMCFIIHYPGFYSSKHLPNWFRLVNAKSSNVRCKFAAKACFILFNYYWINNRLKEQPSCLQLTRDDRNNIQQSMKLFVVFREQITIAIVTSLAKKDEDLQHTVVSTLKKIGKCSVPYVLESLVGWMLTLIGHPACVIPQLVNNCLGAIIEAHRVDLPGTYKKYKKEICIVLAALAVLYHNLEGKRFVKSSMHKIVRTLNFVNFKEFLLKDGHYFLPVLLPRIIKAGKLHLFTDIETSAEVEIKFLLERTFQFVYPQIYVAEEEPVRSLCFEYIETTTCSCLYDLRLANFKMLHNELLLHYGCYPEKVIDALKELARDDPNYEIPNEPMTSQDIVSIVFNLLSCPFRS